MPDRFPFIAIEGTDGSGKSTLRNLLHERLNERGRSCFMVGQHSWLDIEAGRVILAARTQRAGINRTELTGAYARDKWLHLRANILPALRTVTVLSDRYIYSDAVYHDVLYGIPQERTLALHRELGTLLPDVVVFVDAAPAVAFRRTVTRGLQRRAHETEPVIDQLHRGYRKLFTGGLVDPAVRVVRVDNTDTDPETAVRWTMRQLGRLFPDALAPAPLPRAAGDA